LDVVSRGDEGAAKLQEGQMDVSPVLVAELRAPEAVEPGERPFDHPAVASQAVLGLDTTAGDVGADRGLYRMDELSPCDLLVSNETKSRQGSRSE
jgi:hypothetical protein